jgi:hypothetical protein
MPIRYQRAQGLVQRITIELPLEHYQKLQQQAAHQKKSMTQLAREALTPVIESMQTNEE